MSEIITINVDKDLQSRIDRASARFFSNKEIEALRTILVPYGEKAGYFTDEDVFKDIS